MYPFWKYFFYRHFSLARRRDRESLEQMTERFSRAARKDFHLAGLRVVRVWRFPHLSSIEVLGLPLIQVRYSPGKKCFCLGKLELWKVRMSGPVSGKSDSGPLLLPRRTGGRRRLFWNIGPLAFADDRSGVPRVARSLLYSFLTEPPSGFDVCPVYTTGDSAGYFHARSYVREMFGGSSDEALDTPVLFAEGDMLLSPVPDAGEVKIHRHALEALQAGGVKVLFLVHDLIPLRHPEFCPQGFREHFAEWLPLISRFDGVITVSKSVAEDYRRWRSENMMADVPFFVDWFHLGADMEHAAPTRGIPDDAPVLAAAMKARPTFLTVSTVEPRKGYGQALAAFERLWARGIEAGFVIVGRQGWNVGDLAERLEMHPQKGRRLFWLRGISDEYLDRLYASAAGVLFPSLAEGFGLAVVEGARHGRPLILRDIPVFREIAGDHATYFTGMRPEDLADCLEQWLRRREEGAVISSEGIAALTWRESANMLLSRLPRE